MLFHSFPTGSGLYILRFLLNHMRKHGYEWIQSKEDRPLRSMMIIFTGNPPIVREITVLLLRFGADANSELEYAFQKLGLPIVELILAASNIYSRHMTEEKRLKLRLEIFFQVSLTRQLLDIC